MQDDQYTQSRYFSDMPKSSVIIFQTLSLLMSYRLAIIRTVNWWSPYTTCLACSTLTCPACWRTPASKVFNFLRSSLNLIYHSKTRVRDMKLFEGFVAEFFPNRTKNFRFICSLVLIAERPEKADMKKILGLQKARITFIYSKDIQSDDNTVC